MNHALIVSLAKAVQAVPDDADLRVHLAQLLHEAGRHAEALTQINEVIQRDHGNAAALGLLGPVSAALTGAPAAPHQDVERTEHRQADAASAHESAAETPSAAARPADESSFDWDAASRELGSGILPPFTEEKIPVAGGDDETVAPTEPAAPSITLAEVGGLQHVKDRLNESFLAPMRNAEIAKAFGKSLRGGLLLYGPPGCGKTFLARAVAGELGASFIAVSMADVLGPHVGETEKNLRAVFDSARQAAPAVLFLDEIDALGMRRGSLSGSASWMRQMVNQLLMEMDSLAADNDGLYVLAATNHPWDLDEALLRPGRLDRSVLVTPPDAEARESIVRYHLERRPIAGINLAQIAAKTDGFSGADLEHVCTTAAEKAMMASISSNQVEPLTMEHINQALAEVKPSTLPWLEAARNVVRFSNEHGRYDELAEYLVSRKMI